MPNTDDELIIYSDYVCPFCYLGRQSLEAYEADREEPLALDWRPFDLRGHQRGPDGEIDPAVDDGKDAAYYERAKQNVRRLQDRYDVEMTLETAEDVDSLPAQLVSYHVKETDPDRWRVFDEAVLDALWVEGRDIGDSHVLADLATAVGLDPAVVDEALADDALRERVFEQFEAAIQQGVTGVPTFAYEGYAARGAVPPAQLQRLVEGVDDGE